MDMTRRRAFGTALASLAAVAVAPLTTTLARKTFGHLTVEACDARGIDRRRVQVFFNGQLVTGENQRPAVTEADDERGFIVRYATNHRGGYVCGIDSVVTAAGERTYQLAKERVYGRVEIRLT